MIDIYFMAIFNSDTRIDLLIKLYFLLYNWMSYVIFIMLCFKCR